MNMKIAMGAGLAALASVVIGLVVGAGAVERMTIIGYDRYVFGMSLKTMLAAEPQFHATTTPEWLRKFQAVMYEREGTVDLGPDMLPQPGSIRLAFIQNHLAFIDLDMRGQPAYQPDTSSSQNDLWHAVRSAIMGAYSRSLISLDDQRDGHERLVLHDEWGDMLRATHAGDHVSVQFVIDRLARVEGGGF
jgi:hypothetical protein